MKRIAVVLAFALVAPAWGQEQKPSPKEPEQAEKKEPTKEPTRMVSKKPNPANPKRQEDARHCLEKASNTEIIKCSEEYL